MNLHFNCTKSWIFVCKIYSGWNAIFFFFTDGGAKTVCFWQKKFEEEKMISIVFTIFNNAKYLASGLLEQRARLPQDVTRSRRIILPHTKSHLFSFEHNDGIECIQNDITNQEWGFFFNKTQNYLRSETNLFFSIVACTGFSLNKLGEFVFKYVSIKL